MKMSDKKLEEQRRIIRFTEINLLKGIILKHLITGEKYEKIIRQMLKEREN